jgi:hypothetical protein
MSSFGISHDRSEESLWAKAQWFQSLPIEERLELFDEMCEMILAVQPDIVEKKDATPVPGRVRVLTLPPG